MGRTYRGSRRWKIEDRRLNASANGRSSILDFQSSPSGRLGGSDFSLLSRGVSLINDSCELSQCQFQSFIPQHGGEESGAANLLQINFCYDKVFFKVLRLSDYLPSRADHHGASREVSPILEPYPIHVNMIDREILAGGSE